MAPEPPDHFANARATARARRFDGARQARLEALIMALTSRGFEPEDARVPAYLAPLLDLPQTGSESLPPTGQATVSSDGETGGGGDEVKPPRWTAEQLKRAAALLAGILLLSAIAYWAMPYLVSIPPPPPPPTILPTATPSALATPVTIDPPPTEAPRYLLNPTVGGLLLILAALTAVIDGATPALRRWWERRRRRQLRRDLLPDPAPLVALATRRVRAELFSDPVLALAMRKLRRHRAVPSSRIDLRASIRATIRNGTLPTLRFARRRVSPDYLLLSERERPHDHLAQVPAAWRERLIEARIPCAHYEFFGDPNMLRQITDSAGRSSGPNVGRERLDSVLHRHEGAELVVMLESFDALASPDSNPSWLARVGPRAAPHLMNPRAPRLWSELEARLDDLGMTNFAANVAGTLAFADRIDRTIDLGTAYKAPLQTPGQADLAAFLSEHRSLVLSPDRPTDAQVATIIDTLERWLDADAFDWLRALAVFPLVNAGFTCFAGCVLKDSPIITHDRYLSLARLPWLRAAYMPEWFRLSLVETLSPEALARAAATAAAFLQPPDKLPAREEHLVNLRRAAEHLASRKRLARQLQMSANPAFQDRLLIEILKDSPPDKLGVMIDRDLAEDGKAKHRRDRMAVLAIGAIAMIGLLWLQPQEWQKFGAVIIGTLSEPAEVLPMAAPPDVSVETTPAPVESASPSNVDVPPPTEIKGTSASVYIQYALRTQANTAATARRKLNGLKLGGLTLTAPAAEFRGKASPPQTQLRCYDTSGCAIGALMLSELRLIGITAKLVRFSAADLGRKAPQQNNLELWLGTAPNPLPPPPLPACKPATGKENAGPFTVFFDWEKANITAEASVMLDDVVDNYRCGFTVDLTGYTDGQKSAASSRRISQRRAASVRDYLVARGIPAASITSNTFGVPQSRIPTADGVREPQNRRVEITMGAAAVANVPAR